MEVAVLGSPSDIVCRSLWAESNTELVSADLPSLGPVNEQIQAWGPIWLDSYREMNSHRYNRRRWLRGGDPPSRWAPYFRPGTRQAGKVPMQTVSHALNRNGKEETSWPTPWTESSSFRLQASLDDLSVVLQKNAFFVFRFKDAAIAGCLRKRSKHTKFSKERCLWGKHTIILSELIALFWTF